MINKTRIDVGWTSLLLGQTLGKYRLLESLHLLQ